MSNKNLSVRLAVLMLLSLAQLSQLTAQNQTKNKGTFYFLWGYNRDVYSKSTIHFKNTKTDNYDFTFTDAKAEDRSDFHNIGPITKLTIPQYDCHIGYLFNNKGNWGVELSWDHLKYIVIDDQLMHVSGQIRGRAIDKDTVVNADFVHLQHTNGNNYLMANLVKKHRLLGNKYAELSWFNKVGAGPLYTVTISRVLGSYDPGHFRVQGFVLGVNTGLRLDLYKYFFLHGNLQGAYADYLSSELAADRAGKAHHHFYSGSFVFAFGFNYPLK